MSSFQVQSDQLTINDIDPNINNVNRKDDLKEVEVKLNEMKIDDLFISPEPDEYAIALIDTSSSTTIPFSDEIQKGYDDTVFSRECEVLHKLPHKKFFLLFWCSTQSDGLYASGYRTVPGAVSKESMELLFKTEFYKIKGCFLTNTALAFQHIPEAWFKQTKTVYLVTDGAMGCNVSDVELKKQLTTALKNFKGNLSILTVEKHAKNYSDNNEIKNAAGCDVYKLIQHAGLTNSICKFVSHYPGKIDCVTKYAELKSFTHINRIPAPVGYLSYGEKYFLEVHMDRFVQYIAQEIRDSADESAQLAIAQRLSSTLYQLLKNKTTTMIEPNIRMFSRLFTLDQQAIYYILGDSILQEREGRAKIMADYRRNLNNLFADAQRKLNENVSQAIGMDSAFCSYPVIEEKTEIRRILTGPAKMVTEKFVTKNGTFPRGCVAKIPVFNVCNLDNNLSLFNNQCLRQWTRTVYARRFNINIQDDLIIYLVLLEALIINRSAIDISIRNSYLALARTMLNKKRTAVDKTEAKYLQEGNAPTPHNGTVNDFVTILENAMKHIGVKGQVWKVWYEIMSVMDVVFPGILDAQKPQCIALDGQLELPTYEVDSIASASMYDYNCYLTLEDLSAVGGYGFLSHKSPTGFDCSPIFMVSQEGMQTNPFTCPVCYAKLSANSFEKVPPRIESKLPEIYSIEHFQAEQVQAEQVQIEQDDKKYQNINQESKYLILMRGTVGSGKTTLSNYIQQKYSALGYQVFNEGTDKYCRTGIATKQAIGRVRQQLQKAARTSGKCIVIIDTCGEVKSADPFGVSFPGWKVVEVYPNLDRQNQMGYLAWSLTNVLNRGAPSHNTDFYLSPSAGINICREVHKKKAIALGLYDNNFSKLSDSDRLALAAQYAKTIKPTYFELE